MSYQPHVDEYRVSKAVDSEGKYWVWQFEIDGRWLFVAAMKESEVSDFVTNKTFLAEDAGYNYWR